MLVNIIGTVGCKDVGECLKLERQRSKELVGGSYIHENDNQDE